MVGLTIIETMVSHVQKLIKKKEDNDACLTLLWILRELNTLKAEFCGEKVQRKRYSQAIHTFAHRRT